jgi:hypothetical protein
MAIIPSPEAPAHPAPLLLIVDRFEQDSQLLDLVLRSRRGACRAQVTSSLREALNIVATHQTTRGSVPCAVVSEADPFEDLAPLHELQSACDARRIPCAFYVDWPATGKLPAKHPVRSLRCFDAHLGGFYKMADFLCPACGACQAASPPAQPQDANSR